MDYYKMKKELYDGISEKLSKDETIEYNTEVNTFLLEKGCKAMSMPSMTLIAFVSKFEYGCHEEIKSRIEESGLAVNDIFIIYFDTRFGQDSCLFPKDCGMTILDYVDFKWDYLKKGCQSSENLTLEDYDKMKPAGIVYCVWATKRTSFGDCSWKEVLKRFSNREDAEKFKRVWESAWKRNTAIFRSSSNEYPSPSSFDFHDGFATIEEIETY